MDLNLVGLDEGGNCEWQCPDCSFAGHFSYFSVPKPNQIVQKLVDKALLELAVSGRLSGEEEADFIAIMKSLTSAYASNNPRYIKDLVKATRKRAHLIYSGV